MSSILKPGPHMGQRFGAGGLLQLGGSWDALSPLSWATDRNRGASRTISLGQQVAVADLRPDPGVTAREFSVLLSKVALGPIEPVADFVDTSIRAVLTWGIGSAEFSAEADWIDGTVLTMPAEQITVQARYIQNTYPPEDPNLLGLCAPDFEVGAAFSAGGIGRNSNPARLTELIQIPTTLATIDPATGFPLNVRRIPIPRFAISWTAQLVFPSTLAQIDVHGCGMGYATRYDITAPQSNVGQNNVENAFPIRNGAEFFTITNCPCGPEAEQDLQMFVIFGLAL